MHRCAPRAISGRSSLVACTGDHSERRYRNEPQSTIPASRLADFKAFDWISKLKFKVKKEGDQDSCPNEQDSTQPNRCYYFAHRAQRCGNDCAALLTCVVMSPTGWFYCLGAVGWHSQNFGLIGIWQLVDWAAKCWRVTWPITSERAFAATAHSFQSIHSRSASVSSGGRSVFGWRAGLLFGKR